MSASNAVRAITAAAILSGIAFAQQTQAVRDIRVPGKPAFASVWTTPGSSGPETNYTLSLDGKVTTTVLNVNYDLLLRFERFDPVADRPNIPQQLQANSDNRLMIVQYWTQGIEDYRDVIRGLGGEVHLFLANHANVVELSPAAADAVRALSFVRAVVPFHPAFRLEEELVTALREGASGPVKVNLLTTRRGGHEPVAQWVRANGGTVDDISRETHLMTVMLDFAKLPGLASLNEVQWIDRWGAPSADMDIARMLHGSVYLQTQTGFTGQGVRAEVMDVGTEATHPDFSGRVLQHSPTVPSGGHGTCTTGIVLGSGAGNAAATGAMPMGTILTAYFTSFAGGSRYSHSGEIVNPGLPYQGVLQSNSWGGSQVTQYTSTSQNMDLILFDFQKLSILQSQSNLNSQSSRPEAWAKNIISVGGINHRNTLTMSDDFWGGASIGPAADGRIKPDMSSFYDQILCTDQVGNAGYAAGNYFSNFGGTSGATPITGGHLGLFYQMWDAGLFGNATPGATVFANAPNNTTAKAFLVNTATQWTFSGTTHNLTRTHQGWGHADLQRMYDLRNVTYFVDETDVMVQNNSRTHLLTVPAGTAELRATLDYRDPPGTTSSTLHRINDLDLLVVAPNNDVYWGNNGLLAGMTSTSGGVANQVDTVENVYIANPTPGLWRVIAFARDVNQDSHVETGALDVDYALVVTGVTPPPAGCQAAQVLNRPANNPNVYTATLPVIGQPVTLSVNTQGRLFATFVGVALPAKRPLDSGTTALIAPESPIIFRVENVPGPVAMTQVTLPSTCGMVIYSQVKLDNGPGQGVIVTNALDLVIGN
jgi:serine protease AprX